MVHKIEGRFCATPSPKSDISQGLRKTAFQIRSSWQGSLERNWGELARQSKCLVVAKKLISGRDIPYISLTIGSWAYSASLEYSRLQFQLGLHECLGGGRTDIGLWVELQTRLETPEIETFLKSRVSSGLLIRDSRLVFSWRVIIQTKNR